jgi:UDPglucose 6-dehydrogenase
MARKITVVGTGYVGLVSAVGLADFGNTVTGLDIDTRKIEKLRRGESVIYEPGIEEYLKRNLKSGRLSFTADADRAIREAEIIFIAVGTPPKQDGDADLGAIRAVLETVARNLDGFMVIVTKSTVPVGTNRWIKSELTALTGGGNFAVVSNPEFLREGRAVYDFFHPDRVVIGYDDERARNVMEDVYRALYLIQTPFVWCDLETAELVKYASNAFLAMKITFINQMANLAEAVGADIHIVSKTIGMDGRIGPKFLHPGPGYGGSCFPKDTRALAATGDKFGVEMSLIREVIRSNEFQKRRVVDRLESMMGSLVQKRVVVLGLAFKAETDDVRESPAVTIVEKLLEKGAEVRVHDPKAMENFKCLFGPKVSYHEDEFAALTGADAFIICTEWNAYRNIDLARAKEVMRDRYILDSRNVLDMEEAAGHGFLYHGVGRRPEPSVTIEGIIRTNAE